MTWAGHISYGAGWAAYRGNADQQTPHAHATLQLVVASHGDVVVDHGSGTIASAGVLLAPQVRHFTRPSSVDVTFVYAEPQSPLGRTLLSRLKGRKVAPAHGAIVALVRSRLDIEDLVAGLSTQERTSALDGRLTRALQSIEANIGSRTAVSDAARAAELSASRLRALAQSELGLPLAQWIVWRKVERAGRALAGGESLAQAAAVGGFADQAHLTRTMRRAFGVTPGAVLQPLLKNSIDVSLHGGRPRGRAKSNP